MSNKNLTSQESLALIDRMVNAAQSNIRKNAFYFILWGFTISLANLVFYYLARHTEVAHPELIWLITIASGIASGIYGYYQSRDARVKTYSDTIYFHTWMFFIVTILIIIFNGEKVDFAINPTILLLSALATYISGVILRFNPLKFGAFALLLGSLIAFQVPALDQYLVAGITLIPGYVLPGFMLLKNKKNDSI